MDVLIRDLPAEVHAELVRRAAAEDKSLRAHLRELGANHAGGPTGAELVADARVADDELTGR